MVVEVRGGCKGKGYTEGGSKGKCRSVGLSKACNVGGSKVKGRSDGETEGVGKDSTRCRIL